MKKIVLMFALIISAVIGANAQVAIENSKTFDNISIGVTTGVSTPLDFNSMFPLNYNLGLKVQKDFTPIVGLQAEGLILWNDNHFSDLKTAVKGINVGLNAVVNWSNVVCGYKGTPRFFEVNTVTGLGWLHTWSTSANYLTAKTGFDLAFNLGKEKAHSIIVTPAIYWNLSKTGKIQFNKGNAQLALSVGYVYHFKTSNGTHSFKLWPVGDMANAIKEQNEKINKLRGQLEESQNMVEKLGNEKASLEDLTIKQKKAMSYDDWQIVIAFAQNSTALTDKAKRQLDRLDEGVVVDIIGMASPEGNNDYNMNLSSERAKVVKDYLSKNGVKIGEVKGQGVADGKSTNRLTIVIVRPTN